jgi:phosphatidylglycerophosphatase A
MICRVNRCNSRKRVLINSEINAVVVAKPNWRFVFTHPAHFLAFSGGVGLMPVAPGTFGTLAAVPLFWFITPFLEPISFLLLIATMFSLGIWACDKSGRDLGVADHQGMVWDETVAFLLVLFFIPSTYLTQAIGFLIFRFFDILKPQPIRYFDRSLKNGLGVMIDDLVAAFLTLLCFAAMKIAGVNFLEL